MNEEIKIEVLRDFTGLNYLREKWVKPTSGSQAIHPWHYGSAEVVAYSTTSGDMRRVWFLQHPRDCDLLDGVHWPPQNNFVSPSAILVDAASLKVGAPSLWALPRKVSAEVIAREKLHAEKCRKANHHHRVKSSFPLVAMPASKSIWSLWT